MRDTVLIIAPPDDTHAVCLAGLIRSRFQLATRIWDARSLPSLTRFSYSPPSRDEILFRCQELTFSSDSIISIWARRFSPFRIDKSVSKRPVRAFCGRECQSLLYGALDACGVPVINRPADEVAASRKPLQLARARETGFKIPRTLMTNDPTQIREFVRQANRPCIYKTFTPTPSLMTETRILRKSDLRHLASLRLAPMIVQEYVERGLDVRVNVFGNKVFAAEVSPRIKYAKVDWRLDLTAKWRVHELPDVETSRAVDLIKRLGLRYGSLDLRRGRDGQYYFFEVNPSGQFLFIEVDTGQPLSLSLAELLINGR